MAMLNIEKLLSGYNFKSLRECYSVLKILARNNISLEDFYTFIDYQRENYGKNASKIHAENREAKLKLLDRVIAKCPRCDTQLLLNETEETNFESKWVCPKCNYEWFTDISVVDYREIVEAKLRGKEVDFPPEDVRASSEERKRRRGICNKCEYLMQDLKCRACGCGMKHRTYYSILTCPKKKW